MLIMKGLSKKLGKMEASKIESQDDIIFVLNINLETLSDTHFILYIIKVLDKNIFELTSEPLGEEK